MSRSKFAWLRWGGVALAAAGLGSGCQTSVAEGDIEASAPVAAAPTTSSEVAVVEAQAEESNRQLDQDRQQLQAAAWQHVKAIAGMWDELPPEYFPGLTTLVDQVEELRVQIEHPDAIQVGMIEPETLTTHNPAFWRAALETNPEDPMVELFEQMLWAARGNFDRAIWLIELNRYGPALPGNVHALVYALADEMNRIRTRQAMRRNRLLENVPPDQIAPVVATARSFQPADPDWALMSVMVRLQLAGIPMNTLPERPDEVDRLMQGMVDDWRLIAYANPMVGAQLAPDRAVRTAVGDLQDLLSDLGESRGAFGGRDLDRLGEALAATGFWGEALLAKQRAIALRGFNVPSDLEEWWRWLPELIGDEATAELHGDFATGQIRPVTFFQTELGPEGVSLLPLHPILTDRNLRRLQEVQRRLEMSELSDAAKTGALITLAETLGHLGRWDEALAALDEIPETLIEAGAPMRVWVSLWSGRTKNIEALMATVDDEVFTAAPALPALVKAATGDWSAGATEFERAADTEELSGEFRTYYTLMAAAFARLAGEDERADGLIALARERGQGHDWVSSLVKGMAGEVALEPVGNDVTEITEAGRICEQRFYRAFQRDLAPASRRALLEGSVATGVVDFVEYTASLLRLREIDPQRWDPLRVPESTTPTETEEAEEEEDWTSGAAPSWSIPS